MQLRDTYGRRIGYVRLSVTDRFDMLEESFTQSRRGYLDPAAGKPMRGLRRQPGGASLPPSGRAGMAAMAKVRGFSVEYCHGVEKLHRRWAGGA